MFFLKYNWEYSLLYILYWEIHQQNMQRDIITETVIVSVNKVFNW